VTEASSPAAVMASLLGPVLELELDEGSSKLSLRPCTAARNWTVPTTAIWHFSTSPDVLGADAGAVAVSLSILIAGLALSLV